MLVYLAIYFLYVHFLASLPFFYLLFSLSSLISFCLHDLTVWPFPFSFTSSPFLSYYRIFPPLIPCFLFDLFLFSFETIPSTSVLPWCSFISVSVPLSSCLLFFQIANVTTLPSMAHFLLTLIPVLFEFYDIVLNQYFHSLILSLLLLLRVEYYQSVCVKRRWQKLAVL